MNDWDDGLSAGNGASKPSVGFQGKIDSRDQWATKWVYIGFGTLGLLLVAGTFLFLFLSLISAEDRFEAANQSFENGTYGDAIKKFEEFLEKHASHEKAPLAKVKLAHALIADTYKRKNWNETIVRAKTQLPPLVEDEDVDLDVIRQDLAVMLPTSVLNLAKIATKQESKSELTAQLAVAKEAKTLVDNPVYIPGSKRKQANVAKLLDEIDEEIAKGEGLIRKQGDFDKAMTEIKTARESSQTDQAFDSRLWRFACQPGFAGRDAASQPDGSSAG
jgi:tetratricopeptide (TPR) repeat protein